VSGVNQGFPSFISQQDLQKAYALQAAQLNQTLLLNQG
jgi:hypothetical protein